MTAPLRIAVVGAGGIAQVYAQVFASFDGAVITVVVDPAQEAAARLAAPSGAAVRAEHRSVLSSRLLRRVDAAFICTPPATHAPLAIDFLSAGRPVLCEKPLAIGADDAHAMADHAVASGVPLLMASKYRYVEDIARAKDLIVDGIIGDIVEVHTTFGGQVDMSRRWNSQRAISGGGVIIDNGTHAADILRFFAGPVVEVLAVEGPRHQGLDVEDTAQLHARTADGVSAVADLTWSNDAGLPDFTVVRGTGGTVRLGWRRSVVERSGVPDLVIGTGYDKVAAVREQVADFVQLVRGGVARIAIEDALASVAVIDAAYRSLHNAHWEPVAGRSRVGSVSAVTV